MGVRAYLVFAVAVTLGVLFWIGEQFEWVGRGKARAAKAVQGGKLYTLKVRAAEALGLPRRDDRACRRQALGGHRRRLSRDASLCGDQLRLRRRRAGAARHGVRGSAPARCTGPPSPARAGAQCGSFLELARFAPAEAEAWLRQGVSFAEALGPERITANLPLEGELRARGLRGLEYLKRERGRR